MKKHTPNRGIIPFILLTIVGIFMILFAIGFFTDTHPFGLPNFKSILHLDCGLNMYAPRDNATITFPYKIYGYANGCDWEPIDGVLGTATVLGDNGVVITQVDILVTNESEGKPYYFEATIENPDAFYSENGTIIIQNLLPGLQSNYKTIPVHFSSNI